MSTGIEFVLYLGPADNVPSNQCRALHAQLPERRRATIEIMDYKKIAVTLGANKPSWLIGFPTLVSYKPKPDIYKGTAAISKLTEFVQQAPPQQMQQQPMQQPQQMQQSGVGFSRGSAPPPAAQGGNSFGNIGTIGQSSDGSDFNKGSVVSDDLYVSRMESKHGGGPAEQSMRGSRVTSADIEAFNRSRVSRQ